jgi:hypothetical protein
MQDITVRFTDGPLRGQKMVVEVGEVAIGRLPGKGGIELKGADTSVSRVHAELVEQDGNIVLRNLSPNGTSVNGKLIIDETKLESGAAVEIGNRFRFELTWQSFGAETVRTVRPGKDAALKKGPLSSPIVRAVLGVYLAGMFAVAVWFAIASGDGIVGDDWPALLTAYQAWQTKDIADEMWRAREARGELLVRELRALRTQGRRNNTQAICRELMSIDSEIDSPLYRYGARCLASR